MVKVLVIPCLISCLLVQISSADNGGNFARCNCDDEGSLWSIESILDTQKYSDLLIAVAYFSIPLELLWFLSCSNVPFKWVLFEFIAFIVLCGLTHLLNGLTYGPHPFHLMIALTVFKSLTALVSCATAITLFTLIPLLLKVKVREFMLKKKTRDLGREVGLIMKQKETGVHVHMLTNEIRKSLDKHTILYTTLVELSKTLVLQNCAVWMPNEMNSEMILTHQLKESSYSSRYGYSVPINNPAVTRIIESEVVSILRPESVIAAASSGGACEPGLVAAIKMPMLRVSNFKGGTPEVIQTCYAILVCVLPPGEPRYWADQELDIVKVVADQVAVALSHAAVLEESQLMREKLVEQNRALQLAKQNATKASQTRIAFQKIMSDGMRRPMHSILGLLSMMQPGEILNRDQQNIVDTMLKTSDVLSTLINDTMDASRNESRRFPLERKYFNLHSMIKEATSLAKCLSLYEGFGFSIDVEKSLPDRVIGDERRIFQVIMHMVGHLLNKNVGGRGTVSFRVLTESGSQERCDQRWATWRQTSSDEDSVYIRFDVVIEPDPSVSTVQAGGRRHTEDGFEQHLSFSICKKLVQLMRGSIWVVPNSQGLDQSMSLLLQFQIRTSSTSISISESLEPLDHPSSDSLLKDMHVLVADDDNLNRVVTHKLLEKLGCIVTSVSSGFECLSVTGPVSSSFQIVLLDLQTSFELDGFEVAMKIRKFRSRGWPFIIAMTTSTDEDVWKKCLQVGINGVIRKPVVLQQIAIELRRILLQDQKLF